MALAARAAGALVAYLGRTQKAALAQLSGLATYTTERIVPLDPQTRRNLDLFQGGRSGTGRSLLSELDETETAMGARLLRAWLGQPLRDLPELLRRQEAVQWFVDRGLARERARTVLGRIGDVERLVGRVQAGVAQPRELVALRRSLEAAPGLREALGPNPSVPFPAGEGEGTGLFPPSEQEGAGLSSAVSPSPSPIKGEGNTGPHPQGAGMGRDGDLAWLRDEIRPCEDVASLLARAIADEPASPLGEGGVIREGFSPDLDELRAASRNATGYLAGLEQRERERTGIASLKVGYNRVFGYYLEVTKPHLARVPPDFIRRQTLVNGERFITPELKEHEATVLGAQERMAELESALFRQVCSQVAASAPRLLATARAVAQADVLACFAEVASRRGYCRPALSDGPAIRIKGGRHPVVERVLPQGTFVPNDLELGADCSLILLTGPNMGGKSTFLRQAALIVLMAQVGSFVPAEASEVGLVDRIFTRVGLQDDLTTGLSTFMVEMVETAQILNNATPRSLVVLDEIGRGTSTYDGLAIARAVAEYLHSSPRLGCRTLFATHYHELTELASALPRVRNFHVSALEEDGKVVFLHQVQPGGADRSYGVHVAQLAGLPRAVVNRARDVLQELEDGQSADLRRLGRLGNREGKRSKQAVQGTAQLPLLPDAKEHPVVKALAELDLDGMTPLEALNRLYELQRRVKSEEAPPSSPSP
ncbi:MAG: DNA mismatch repair protein MutS [Dehalococcoidia bacterium]|nr:DNA mismatch repair protein MutS [Dehalococcoidia bacterium]